MAVLIKQGRNLDWSHGQSQIDNKTIKECR